MNENANPGCRGTLIGLAILLVAAGIGWGAYLITAAI